MSLMPVVEYSFVLAGVALVVTGIVSFKAVSEVSKITKDLQRVVTAVSGKSREYGEIRAIDKAYDEKPKEIKIAPKNPKVKDKPEDMVL
jgi:hypothetical protein